MPPDRFTSTTYPDPSSFLTAHGAHLTSTRPIAANFALGPSYRLAFSPFTPSPTSTWAAVARVTDGALFAVTLPATGHPTALASSIDPALLTPDERKEAMGALASALDASGVPTTAVHNAVGPRVLAEAFADAWAVRRGVRTREVPMGHFYLTSVTKDTLLEQSPMRPAPEGLVVRLPGVQDVEGMARMCFEFARPSAHVHSMESARAEAEWLQAGGHAWVGEVDGEVLGMVGVKRRSPGVCAVSKVWTEPRARGRGVAEGMVREVCKAIFESGVENVCLFFDHSNPVASRLYARLGFPGTDKAEEWMEVGYDIPHT